MAKLAFYTFGILHEAQGNPRVQGFFDRVSDTFKEAEQSTGFIGRSSRDPLTGEHSWGERVSPRFFVGDETDGLKAPRTVSLWEDLESVFAYAYSGLHAEALRQRREWFVKPQWPAYVAWWVADDHIPDWVEAAERHEHLHDHGSTPFAFDFKQPFDCNAQPVKLHKRLTSKGCPFQHTVKEPSQ